MTLNKIVPLGRKQLPIWHIEDYRPPALWVDFNHPLRQVERLMEVAVTLHKHLD